MPTLEEQAKDLKQLTTEFREFKEVCKKRTLQDNYRFAEIAEADDFKYNLSNADRVMVNGELPNKYYI